MVSSLLSFLTGGVVYAAAEEVPVVDLGFRPPDFGTLLAFSLRFLFIIGGLAAIIYLILGALAWITSGGDKENVTKAREKIQAAVIGLVLIIGVLAIIGLMENLLFPPNSGLGITKPIKFPSLISPAPGGSD